MAEPVGAREIARRLRVSRETVRRWRDGGVLPAACYVVDGRPGWEWSEISAWAVARGRLGEDGAPSPRRVLPIGEHARVEDFGWVVEACAAAGGEWRSLRSAGRNLELHPYVAGNVLRSAARVGVLEAFQVGATRTGYRLSSR